MRFLAFIPIVIFFKSTDCLSFDQIFQKNNVTELIELLIPTTNAPSAQCRADSRFYFEELLKFKLWATEMFDATSKFSSGILYGSSHDLGNFDECIEVRVPIRNKDLKGKYCMAKFHIEPPEGSHDDLSFHYQYYKTGNFINVSTWEKLVAFSNDRARCSRADFYLSFCIPSTCDNTDLETSLKNLLENVTDITQFPVQVQVNEINCCTDEKLIFTTGDITFIALISVIMLLVSIATLYDLLTKAGDFGNYKLKGLKHKVLRSFSLYKNLKKIAHLKPNDKQQERLASIHGFKVISMFLVIMGHRMMFLIGSPIVNPNYIESMYHRLEATCLLNGPIIVDTFFVISGFLASYLLITEWDKRKHINVPYLYLHRILRFSAAYGVVVAFYCTIFIKIGSGPFWQERIGVEQERCLASWWANLLYVNNYINIDQICMFQSWYVACDLHYFLTTPIIIWILRKNSLLGSAFLAGLVFVSIGVVFAVVYLNNEEGILLLYRRFLRDPVTNNNFKNVYIPTHMRAAPYFVGTFAGYIRYKMEKNAVKIPKCLVYIGWIIAALAGCATMYFPFIFYNAGKNTHNAFLHATYASFHHFIFSLIISWMIIAIVDGHGRWIEPFFSWRPLILLSRISYAVFLSHGAIQLYSVATIRQANYASVFNLISSTASDITLAYIMGLVLSMCFEAPIVSLEKTLLRKGSKQKDKQLPTT